MHLRFGRTLGPEIVPEDNASNVDLEAILGSSLTARGRSPLNSTSSVLGPLFEYESSTDETMSMEDNMSNQNEIQISIAANSGTQSPTQSTSNRMYEGITNFFGRFDPRAQLFDSTEDMNALAHTNTVTLGPLVVIEHMTSMMTPPSENDLHSQNLHAEGGLVFQFDLEVGLFEIRGNYRSHLDISQMEANV